MQGQGQASKKLRHVPGCVQLAIRASSLGRHVEQELGSFVNLEFVHLQADVDGECGNEDIPGGHKDCSMVGRRPALVEGIASVHIVKDEQPFGRWSTAQSALLARVPL